MTKKILLLTLLFQLISCDNISRNNKINSLGINFKIFPEFDDGTYYIKWKDTLGQKNGFDQFNRPIEIWCVITNTKNDTIGYYKGLSTPQKMAYFTTKDSIINLDFKVGINFFSEIYYGNSEKNNRKLWDLNVSKMTSFETIELDLKRELLKNKILY